MAALKTVCGIEFEVDDEDAIAARKKFDVENNIHYGGI